MKRRAVSLFKEFYPAGHDVGTTSAPLDSYFDSTSHRWTWPLQEWRPVKGSFDGVL
jgi:hypothetical protein